MTEEQDNLLFLNSLCTRRKRAHPISDFLFLELCTYCRNGNGCECCEGGIIYYSFNSEPNEPNVIGMMDKMVNDLR